MIFDLHNDLLTAQKPDAAKRLAFDEGVVYAVWTTGLDDPAGFIQGLSVNAPMLTAVEDLGFLSDGGFIGDAGLLLKKLNPVYASLTWNGENAFAGGANTDAGLTQRGERMIALLENAGILLDVAHLSRPAFFRAAEVARQPFICSHTCFDGVFGHRRNLTDLQIKTVAGCGGLIGLCLVPSFMGKERAGVGDVVRQIDYFVQKFGDGGLAIGTDFNGCDFPALEGYSGFDRVGEDLLKKGYTQTSVEKIFCLNAREFLNKRKLI